MAAAREKASGWRHFVVALDSYSYGGNGGVSQLPELR